MKRNRIILIAAVFICACILGCAGLKNRAASEPVDDKTAVSESPDTQDMENAEKTEDTEETVGGTAIQEPVDGNAQEEENREEGKMYIKIGEHTLTATMADNSSAEALLEKLQEGDITIDAHDFSNFEKVGELGFSLPTNNEQITTQAGDLILYQGKNFVLYYDTNSWNFTRLGKVEGVTQKELKQILGTGDVTMVLSLNE